MLDQPLKQKSSNGRKLGGTNTSWCTLCTSLVASWECMFSSTAFKVRFQENKAKCDGSYTKSQTYQTSQSLVSFSNKTEMCFQYLEVRRRLFLNKKPHKLVYDSPSRAHSTTAPTHCSAVSTEQYPGITLKRLRSEE